MSTDEHLDNYRKLKAQLIKSIGKPIAGFAFVVVDAKGEVYYGGDYSDDARTNSLIAVKLAEMLKGTKFNAKEIEKRTVKNVPA